MDSTAGTEPAATSDGNRPELMPLDSHLNADHERGLKYHVALTSDYLPKKPDGSKNLQKFCLGSPEEVSSAMDRTWEVFPEPDRIISDILKYPKALKAIAEAAGGIVFGLGKRTGRRKYLRVLPHHPDCNDAVAARRLKWEKYHENAAESAESDSDSEEVDITESESDEEDPLADIL